MSVDATNNVNVQLRAIGGAGDDAGSTGGIPVYTSPRALTGQTDANGIHRSGDYSYIALYPAAALGCTSANEIGILTGETAGPSLGLWGHRPSVPRIRSCGNQSRRPEVKCLFPAPACQPRDGQRPA